MSNFSINFSAVLNPQSGNVPALRGMCVAPDGQTYLLATSAARSTSRYLAGVSITAGSSTTPNISIQYDGEISGALGAGAYTLCVIDSSGVVKRATQLALTDTVIGVVDTAGNIALDLGRAKRPLELSPLDFGCPWDGVHDDLPGWIAMMKTVPSTGCAIRLPLGMGYFSDNVHINAQVTIYGHGAANASGFIFPCGKGMFVNGAQVTTYGAAQADYGGIHGCTFRSALMQIGTDSWHVGYGRQPSTYTELGWVVRRVYAGTNTVCFFRVTTAGVTSSGSEPAFTATTPGVTYQDGGVVWTSECFPFDYQPNHVYAVGERVFVPGDNRYYFECVTAGTSAATDALLNQAQITYSVHAADVGAVFADGPNTLTWRVKVHAGISVTASYCKFTNNYFLGFTGAAFHLQADSAGSPATFCDFTSISDCSASYCGVGLITNGFDANGITVDNLTTLFMGQGRTSRDANIGTGGHTVWDRGLGNKFSGCYSQTAAAPAYRTDGSASGLFVGCRSENSVSEYLLAGGTIFIGSTVQGVNRLSNALFLNSPPTGGANLRETVAGSPSRTAAISGTNVVHWFQASDETGATGWSRGEFISWPKGWWALGNTSNAQVSQSLGVTGEKAVWPVGPGGLGTDLIGSFRTVVCGPLMFGIPAMTSDPQTVDFGAAAPTTGFWTRGSIRYNSAAAVGATNGWRCTVTGTPGTWVALANL